MRKACRFSCRETGELPHMMMIKASRKDEWGAPTSTGASALVACRPFVVIQKPEKNLSKHSLSKVLRQQRRLNQSFEFVLSQSLLNKVGHLSRFLGKKLTLGVCTWLWN